MDKFPEAFERFEDDVEIEEIEGYSELKICFSEWLGRGWKNSTKQNAALRIEAEKAGIVKQSKASMREHGKFEKHVPKRRTPEQPAKMPPDYILPEKQTYYVYPETIKANIKVKIERGYSANQIQKQLQNQGIGVRRQVLLRQIREQRHIPQRQHPERYTPRKYRKKRPQT